jgi:hypothetical protein
MAALLRASERGFPSVWWRLGIARRLAFSLGFHAPVTPRL